jgi:hypothetical protein
MLTGCTSNLSQVAGSSENSGSLEVSPSAVSFGGVTVGKTASSGVSLVNQSSSAVEISHLTVSGEPFSVSGAASLPITVPARATYNLGVNFSPTGTGAATGKLEITSSSASVGTLTVNLSGMGAALSAPALSGLNCARSSFAGPATADCGVTMSAAASGSGVAVALASNDRAVIVPSTVVVPAGATKVSFTASVNPVSTAQTATLTASAGGVSESVALELGATVAALNASTSSVAFGNVNVNTASTQQVTLTSSGDAPVTINSVTVAGAGFSLSGVDTPQTLSPNQTVTLNVQFNPTAPGTTTGQLIIASNATSGGTMTIGLGGTGTIMILPALHALNCASGSLLGSASDACTVAINGTAPNGGVTVNLQSSAAAVSVPQSVQIAAGATSATFTATATAVSTAQAVTLTASTGNSAETFVLHLGASVPTLSVSTTSLAFGNVAVGSTATQSLVLSSTGTAYVTLNAATMSGSGFSATGAGFPLNLSPGQTATLTVQFDPTATGATAGALTLNGNSSTGASTTVSLGGTGVPVLNGLTCANGSMTEAGTDNCTVTLNAPAGNGGYMVSLASNNSAVKVPGTVLIPAGSTSTSFAATVAAVSSAATATLTANASSVTETFAIQLSSSSGQLNLSTTSLNFGDVLLKTPTTQTLSLSTSSLLPITVSLATVTGTGFSLLGSGLPLVLTTGQPATIQVQFDPTAAVSSTGTLTIVSTSLTNPTTVVSLSGTGVSATYQVNLAWDAPTSSTDPVAGYEVLRSSDGGNTYQELNSSAVSQTAYVDSSVQDGQTYLYEVESMDTDGVASAPSNSVTVAVP